MTPAMTQQPTADPAVVRSSLLLTPERQETLSAALPCHIELLGQRRTADVPSDHLDGYLALGWLRWAGSRLVVTTQGSAVRDSVVAKDELRTFR
jgi:hypothetical protein